MSQARPARPSHHTAAHTATQAPGSHGTTQVSGPPLTGMQMTVLGVFAILLLWVAYRVGRVVVRVVAGLLFLILVLVGIWYLFLK